MEENVEWKKLAGEKIIRLVSSELKVNAEMNTGFGYFLSMGRWVRRGVVSVIFNQPTMGI